jgi:hypothetical protein
MEKEYIDGLYQTYWQDNANNPNCWTLWRDRFKIGRYWGEDKTIQDLLGGVDLNSNGKYEVGVICHNEDDPDEDWKVIEEFDDLETAKQFLLHNH